MDTPSTPEGATPAASIRTAGVDLSGLMSVLSKHLYSTPIVALRELIQNAHDSIVRRRLEDPSWQDAGRIDVLIDRQQRTIRIRDTGAGLTEAEIHSYLATVGVGYTRTLRQQDDDTGLIGMFGLGFLSAFVVAQRVSVYSTSYQTPTLGHCYRSSNAEQYSVTPTPARAVGSEVLLELRDGYEHLANPQNLRAVLGRYCALLRAPIYIDDDAQAVNPEPPPWRQAQEVAVHPTQVLKRNLAFAAHFEHDFEPICTLDVRPDGQSDAVGLLWLQDGATYGTSDNRNLSVFVRGMLLDDEARDLLPPWAGFIGGVIESDRLTPTASREDLQRDAHYLAVQRHLNEALITGLSEVARQQPQAWRRVLLRHNEALLGAALCDERLFQLLMENLRIPSSQGDLPVQELVRNGTVHVVLDRDNDFESLLFHAMGTPLAQGYRYAVIPFLRRWCQAKGLRIVELGTDQGNRQLFEEASLPAEELAWLQTHLADGEQCLPARFQPHELPLMVMPDREAQLRQRLEEDSNDKRISHAALRLARQFASRYEGRALQRLYLNLANPALQALLAARAAGHPNVDIAARLLKAFKVISNARHQPDAGQSLAAALTGLSQSLEQLLTAHEHH
ncbi:MAG: Chaperone protein HtpG [Stenotrophomonas maltophilia]|nr:MAG: Chaperone protein HtpG [Stenotrophomonas maltophilia]